VQAALACEDGCEHISGSDCLRQDKLAIAKADKSFTSKRLSERKVAGEKGVPIISEAETFTLPLSKGEATAKLNRRVNKKLCFSSFVSPSAMLEVSFR
jgi:hypothetical protein